MAVVEESAVGLGSFDDPLPGVPLSDPATATGQEAEAGLVAWQRRLNHDAWRRACWMREAARARADVVERWPEADPRVIAAALGWSVSMAASRLEAAEGVLERLPRLGESMRAGTTEEPKAAKFVVGLRDVTDEQARAVVDALIDEAPGLGLWELEQRIAAAVKDVDPLGAENRRAAAVARGRVRARIAPSGAAELHGLDLEPDTAVEAHARLAAIAEVVSERLAECGQELPPSRVQAQVYLRLLTGCPAGDDDVSVADHVLSELRRPGPAAEEPVDLDDLAPDPDDPHPDDPHPDDDVGDGPDGDSAPDEPDDGPGPGDQGPDDTGPDDTGPAGPTVAAGRANDAAGADDPDDPPRPWQPDDPPPGSPPPDTPDPTLPTGDPPPDLAARLTTRGLTFPPTTLRTTLATVLGLGHSHGRLPLGALTGPDARRMAWARTCGQFRVLLYDDDGHLAWVLLVRPPHLPGADPRYRRHVVELQAHVAEVDALDPDTQLVGIWAEFARRTQAALAEQRARPSEDHPARTTRDTDRRSPGAELTRYVHARDGTCRFPMCTVPAVACPIDHTHDFGLGGRTQADNLGPLSVGDHLRKHDPRSGWTVRQTSPGTFVWTSPTGTHHVVRPPRFRPLRPIGRRRFDHGLPAVDPGPTASRPPRPWRPRTDRFGHVTDAQRLTLADIERRRRAQEACPSDPSDGDPPF